MKVWSPLLPQWEEIGQLAFMFGLCPSISCLARCSHPAGTSGPRCPVGAENSICTLTRTSAGPTTFAPTTGATESRTRVTRRRSTLPPWTSSLVAASDEVFGTLGLADVRQRIAHFASRLRPRCITYGEGRLAPHFDVARGLARPHARHRTLRAHHSRPQTDHNASQRVITSLSAPELL